MAQSGNNLYELHKVKKKCFEIIQPKLLDSQKIIQKWITQEKGRTLFSLMIFCIFTAIYQRKTVSLWLIFAIWREKKYKTVEKMKTKILSRAVNQWFRMC